MPAECANAAEGKPASDHNTLRLSSEKLIGNELRSQHITRKDVMEKRLMFAGKLLRNID
jgi:hypothetical protein